MITVQNQVELCRIIEEICYEWKTGKKGNGKGEKIFSMPNIEVIVKQNETLMLKMFGLVIIFTWIFHKLKLGSEIMVTNRRSGQK
jgi:hypothetical protein